MRELSSIEKRDEAERQLKSTLAQIEEGENFKRKALENFYWKCERGGYGTRPEWQVPANAVVIENDSEIVGEGIDFNSLPEPLKAEYRTILSQHDKNLVGLYAEAWKLQELVVKLNEEIKREIQPDFDKDKEPFKRFLLDGFELSQYAPKKEKDVEDYLLNLYRFQKAVIDWTLQAVNKSLYEIRVPVSAVNAAGEGDATEELRELKRKFNQVPDRKRENLFKKAVELYCKKMAKSKTKRGYSWKKAVEDANKSSKEFYTDTEFDDRYDAIVNHFNQWRKRNSAYIQGRLKSYTV